MEPGNVTGLQRQTEDWGGQRGYNLQSREPQNKNIFKEIFQ